MKSIVKLYSFTKNQLFCTVVVLSFVLFFFLNCNTVSQRVQSNVVRKQIQNVINVHYSNARRSRQTEIYMRTYFVSILREGQPAKYLAL